MATKATFLVDRITTKKDKPIPFTNEVIKAGTEGQVVSIKYHDTYIMRFSEDFINWLYLEYKISELAIEGNLESINFVEEAV